MTSRAKKIIDNELSEKEVEIEPIPVSDFEEEDDIKVVKKLGVKLVILVTTEDRAVIKHVMNKKKVDSKEALKIIDKAIADKKSYVGIKAGKLIDDSGSGLDMAVVEPKSLDKFLGLD